MAGTKRRVVGHERSAERVFSIKMPFFRLLRGLHSLRSVCLLLWAGLWRHGERLNS